MTYENLEPMLIINVTSAHSATDDAAAMKIFHV
jgi:hypothetical protein